MPGHSACLEVNTNGSGSDTEYKGAWDVHMSIPVPLTRFGRKQGLPHRANTQPGSASSFRCQQRDTRRPRGTGINSDTVRTAGNGDPQDLCYMASSQTWVECSPRGVWCGWGMPWDHEVLLTPLTPPQPRALPCPVEELGSLHRFCMSSGHQPLLKETSLSCLDICFTTLPCHRADQQWSLATGCLVHSLLSCSFV